MRSLAVVLMMNGVFLLACSRTVQESQLIGQYVLQSSNVVAQLNLRPDGSFEQTVARESSTYTNTGTWKWDEQLGMLVLTDAIDVNSGRAAREWIIALPVEKGFRSVRLEVDSATGDAYVKR